MANPQDQGLLRESDSHGAKSQRGRYRFKSTLYTKLFRDWWLAEVLSVVVGIASIVALCRILKKYDDKPAPRANAVFGINITLNTLVSILSTLGRAALLLSVAECISQLKWTWYLDKDRPLGDLDIFDEASRGAWGGLLLLWKINIRYALPFEAVIKSSTDRLSSQIASVGALLIIAGLAVDPLSQQLIQFKVRIVPSSYGSANLPAAVTWDDAIQDTTNNAYGKSHPQSWYRRT